jgi:hypothetical protein
VNGEDISLVTGTGGEKRIAGHWRGLATRIRHQSGSGL